MKMLEEVHENAEPAAPGRLSSMLRPQLFTAGCSVTMRASRWSVAVSNGKPFETFEIL